MHYRFAVLLLAGITPAFGLAAQTPAKADSTHAAQLPELQVTGERQQAAAPAVTTLEVNPETLRRTQAVNAYDLVRRSTGIEVHDQGQGPGYASDVVLRGFSSDHSSDVLLTIDGVPINLPVHGHVEGYSDWSILSPAAVSSFRVISGTASPLYGDFAMGGVVEVFTAPDADGTAGAVNGSSYGDAGGWVRGGHRSADGGFLLAFDGRRQQGWRDNSDYWLGNGLLRGWRPLGSGRLEGGIAAYGSSWDSPGFVSVADYNAGQSEHAMDPTDGGSSERVIAHGRLTSNLGAVGLDASAWAQQVRSSVYLTIPEDGLLNQSDEEDRRWALGGRMQAAHPINGGDLSAGLDARIDFDTYDLYRTEQRSRLRPTKSFDGRYAGGGAFVRGRRLVGSHLALDLGARLDLLHYRTRDRLADALVWRDATQTVFGPKLGARWITASGVSFLASVSRGFRGAPGVIEDPTIPPIEAWTKEVGIEYARADLRLHIAAFRLDVSHERIQDPVTREVSSVGGSVRQGLNGEAEVRVLPRLTLFAEATVNDAKISDEASASALVVDLDASAAPVVPKPSFHIEPLSPGDPVPNVARWVGRLGLESQLARNLAGRGSVRFSGPYTPIGESAVRTQSYAVVDIGASIAVSALRGTLDLDLDNVLDTKYPEVRASNFLNPGAPRTLRAALRFGGAP